MGFATLDDAKLFIKENPYYVITKFERNKSKYGDDRIYYRGRIDTDIEVRPEMFGDEYDEYSCERKDMERFRERINEILCNHEYSDFSTISSINDILEKYDELNEHYDEKEDTEMVITKNDDYYITTPRHTMCWKHEDKMICVGVSYYTSK